ncbi:MAG TPA: tRNA uridine(34) 5-carboxymethylaminomethyl modification radical SAM/GNAT enzyme Elp3 [bacterium]|nr:tRNA uridine(34) 5-carboxymethylaminomethyl modification radical SAM/GNAT enzyme Elp3 [bacterium]
MFQEYNKNIKKIFTKLPKNEAELAVLKRKFAKQNKTNLLTNAELLKAYRGLVKSKKIKSDKNLEELFKKRHIRTLSGVAPVAVLIKPYKCPGNCVYCPTEKNMPKSYLSNEPAVMRAVLCQFDPFKQVALRIRALENNGHETDKIELIIMGGTWDYLPEKYRLCFVYNCFLAANNYKKNKISKLVNKITWDDLYTEQKKNETAKHRIVGLTLETRPDYITEKSAWAMRELGCTRVELGVQHIDDQILKLNKRGHGVKETIKATKILRDLGFKITYHLMLNLPGSNPDKDFLMFKKLFSDYNFQPDQIKIYPCVVNEYAELYNWWKKGQYKPYTTKKLTMLLIKIKKIIPYYVRIIRVIRDIPEESIAAGNKITNLRHLLKVECKCIRCREVGHQIERQKAKGKRQKMGTKMFIEKYNANGGTEYFLSMESEDRKILYAFCRLRLPKSINLSAGAKNGSLGVQADKIAIIRELHSYGQLTPIGSKIKLSSQHKGLGKKLLIEAEKIAQKNGFQEIAVIAGIGVREYYKKLGYTELRQTYLIKKLK